MNTATDDWAESDETIDLAAVFDRLWKKRLWIALAILVGTGLATAYALLATPIYRASVLLVPANEGPGAGLDGALGQLGGLASLAGFQVGNMNLAKEEALAVLRSRELTEKFIADKNLLPVLFHKRWDSQMEAWKDGVKPPTPAEAYKYFTGEIRGLTEDKKTGLVTLQIDWRDRMEAAAWANELVARLNTEMQGRAINAAEASVGYLEKELETTNIVETRQAINRLIEAQIKQRMVANVTKEFAFRVVDKAMAPDEDDPIRPRKMLLVAGGFFGGAVLSMGLILFSGLALSSRPRRSYNTNEK